MPYLASMFVSYKYRPYLWWAGFLMEILFFMGTIFLLKLIWGTKWAIYRVAVNIEHQTERFCCLTMAVLGEVVVALLWPSDYKNMSTPYWATILGLIVATSFQWLYFNIDRLHHYTHAIRRSAGTAIFWLYFHIPFHLALTTAGGALATLIAIVKSSNDAKKLIAVAGPSADGVYIPTKVSTSVRIVWFGALAVALACSAAIGMMHKNHDHHVRIPKKYRASVRWIVSGVFALNMILIPAVILIAQTILEEYGRLNNPHYKHDHHHSHSHHHHDHHTKPIESPTATTPPFLTATAPSNATLISDPKPTETSDYDPPPCMKNFVHNVTDQSTDVENAPAPKVRRRRFEKFVKRWHGEGGGAHLL
ncbi:hypothetical protein BC829DRAFT_395276 [Chytridium lagenaria]|nr:hypothetical protein BC829DRAFT_395276 [Chytridium lagenaria]